MPSDNARRRTVTEFRGPEKAAALLIAIGRGSASRLLKYLDEDDLRRLAAYARRLPAISADDCEVLVRQFEALFAEGAPLDGAGSRFEGLLREVLSPEQASAVIEGRHHDLLSAEPVWDQLPRAPLEALHGYFAGEHPQTTAYVLSRLPKNLAAKLLLGFPAPMRTGIVRRVLHIGNVGDMATSALEFIIRRDITNNDKLGKDTNQHGAIADMLNHLKKSEIDEMLDSLADLNVEDLTRIKEKLFSFEDIIRLTPQARMTLFDEVQADKVALALRGTEPGLRETVLSSLSARGRRMVEAELVGVDDNPNAPDVVAARQTIAALAIRLSEQGEISIAPAEQLAS
jgi:flagellar motor switch protein FliG